MRLRSGLWWSAGVVRKKRSQQSSWAGSATRSVVPGGTKGASRRRGEESRKERASCEDPVAGPRGAASLRGRQVSGAHLCCIALYGQRVPCRRPWGLPGRLLPLLAHPCPLPLCLQPPLLSPWPPDSLRSGGFSLSLSELGKESRPRRSLGCSRLSSGQGDVWWPSSHVPGSPPREVPPRTQPRPWSRRRNQPSRPASGGQPRTRGPLSAVPSSDALSCCPGMGAVSFSVSPPPLPPQVTWLAGDRTGVPGPCLSYWTGLLGPGSALC